MTQGWFLEKLLQKFILRFLQKVFKGFSKRWIFLLKSQMRFPYIFVQAFFVQGNLLFLQGFFQIFPYKFLWNYVQESFKVHFCTKKKRFIWVSSETPPRITLNILKEIYFKISPKISPSNCFRILYRDSYSIFFFINSSS